MVYEPNSPFEFAFNNISPSAKNKATSRSLCPFITAMEIGYWAEFPAIPGCATQCGTFEKTLKKTYEAVESYLSVDIESPDITEGKRILEIAV